MDATAEELLSELKQLYAFDDERLARKELSSITQGDLESISAYHRRFEILMQRDPGHDYDIFRFERFIFGLRPAFYSQIEAAQAIPHMPEWTAVQTLAYLKSIEVADTRATAAAASMADSYSASSSPDRPNKRKEAEQLTSPRYRASNVSCTTCGRRDHTVEKCYVVGTDPAVSENYNPNVF